MTTENVNTMIMERALCVTREYDESKGFLKEVRTKTLEFANNHKLSVGIVEIAAGLAAISGGIAAGGLLESVNRIPEFLGVLGGGGLAGSFGYLLGGIGVAVGGTAFGVPVLAVTAISALSGSILGYLGGSSINSILGTQITFMDQLGGAALIAAGLWLVYDGIKRILMSDKFTDIVNDAKMMFQKIFFIM